jgi:hypothetical protein
MAGDLSFAEHPFDSAAEASFVEPLVIRDDEEPGPVPLLDDLPAWIRNGARWRVSFWRCSSTAQRICQ